MELRTILPMEAKKSGLRGENASVAKNIRAIKLTIVMSKISHTTNIIFYDRFVKRKYLCGIYNILLHILSKCFFHCKIDDNKQSYFT